MNYFIIVLELTEFIEEKLKELNVKRFDYLQFSDLELIGAGGSANVYSAKFYGQQYALKSLRNTLRMEHREAMSFIREIREYYHVRTYYGEKFHVITADFYNEILPIASTVCNG
ncbi:21796_t:CDS:2 [Dentiscutata erythropus]|uniref:21796_t:CDS:1 n=1 Tax=Dentiscutata erythropus TaxID=1348616 RepID=A0A9N9ASC6_9GLOM|nr:21796_t:CDS:2 [Dentiscutata erythropus]